MANTGVRDEAMNIHVYIGATMCIGTGGQIGSNVKAVRIPERTPQSVPVVM
jgi:hypothetical protein